MRRGIVISDLHLLSWRSEGQRRFDELAELLHTADDLVLNGDIFDFRWALRPHTETIPEAVSWLETLALSFPELEVYFIPGNHDCLPAFVSELEKTNSVSLHKHHLILGRNLFLHGDAATWKMKTEGFRRFRKGWENDVPSGRIKKQMYNMSDRLKISDLAHTVWFRGDTAVSRMAHYLEHSLPGWKEEIDQCFFGHTHIPIDHTNEDGIRFCNTGSGIRNLPFVPAEFSWWKTQ